MANTIHIQLRGDTGENWTSRNPILLRNEVGYDQTSRRLKFGDGTTAWKDLPYIAPDVINDLLSGGESSALSAEQGKVLKGILDTKADSSDVRELLTSLTEVTERVTEMRKELTDDVIKRDELISEVWRFTLEDDSVIEKAVALWSS